MSYLASIPRRVYAYYIDPSPITARIAFLFLVLIALEIGLVVYLIRQSEPWWFDAQGLLYRFRYLSAATTALLAAADVALIYRRSLLPVYRSHFPTRKPSRARS